jgi:RHS repeat-associated protein
VSLRRPATSAQVAACYASYAANERLEVRSGRPAAADWEWGLGANTQSSSLFTNINTIDWVSGKAVRFTLQYDGLGNGTLTLRDSVTNAVLATKTYTGTGTNVANPLRVGNAIRLYVKQNAGIGQGAKVRAKITAINGVAVTTQQATELDLETTGDNLYSEKMAYAQTSSQPLTQASTQSMTIEGEITLTWTGAASAIPTGSRLGVTINAGQAPCVVGVGAGGTGGSGSGTGTTAPAQNYYIHADHLGSPRTITRASDNVKVWEWKNDDAFGNNAADENPNAANSVNGAAATFTYNLRFPGQYFDKETNTNYNYFRDYDPTTGRYVQSDPIGLKGGINTFRYVGGEPLKWFDRFGLEPGSLEQRGYIIPPMPSYDSALYNNLTFLRAFNCYAYAINRAGKLSTVWSGTGGWQPGELSGKKFSSFTCSDIIAAAKRDGAVEASGKGECGGECPIGYWKVKLVVSNDVFNNDYHWFRQNSDGEWAGKEGGGDVRRAGRSCPVPFDKYKIDCGVLCVTQR